MKGRPFLAVVLAVVLLTFSLGLGGWWLIGQRGPLQLAHHALSIPRAARFVPAQAPLSLYWFSDGEQPVAYARAVAPARQRRAAGEALERLRDGAFAAAGLDYHDELASWLAPGIALVLFDEPATGSGDGPSASGGLPAGGWLLALASRDDDGARHFLQRFWQTRSLAGTDLQVSSYRGMGLISGRGALLGRRAMPLATALVDDDLVLIASGRTVLERALDVSQISELNQASQPGLQRELDRLGDGAALLLARPQALEQWLGWPLPAASEQRPTQLLASLRPEGRSLLLHGHLQLPAPSRSLAAAPAMATGTADLAAASPDLENLVAMNLAAVPLAGPTAAASPPGAAAFALALSTTGPAPQLAAASAGPSAPWRPAQARGPLPNPAPITATLAAVTEPARQSLPLADPSSTPAPSAAAPTPSLAPSESASTGPPATDSFSTSPPSTAPRSSVAEPGAPSPATPSPTAATAPTAPVAPAPAPIDSAASSSATVPPATSLSTPAPQATPPATPVPPVTPPSATAPQAVAPSPTAPSLTDSTPTPSQPERSSALPPAPARPAPATPVPGTSEARSPVAPLPSADPAQRQALLEGLRGPLTSLLWLQNPASQLQQPLLQPLLQRALASTTGGVAPIATPGTAAGSGEVIAGGPPARKSGHQSAAQATGDPAETTARQRLEERPGAAAGPLPLLVAQNAQGPQLLAAGPEGWQMGTAAGQPPAALLEPALASQGLIQAPLEFGGRSLQVWTRLEAPGQRGGHRPGQGGSGESLQAPLAAWRQVSGPLAWWGRNLAVLDQSPGGRGNQELQAALLALDRAGAPLQWALTAAPSRELLRGWQPWQRLSALAGGGLDGSLQSLALAWEPEGTTLHIQARLSFDR